MTCQEALALLYDVIDHEASAKEIKQVTQHLSSCKNCSDIYRVEQAADELLKAKLQGDAPAPELDQLRANLKSNVMTALDAMDSGHSCSMEKKSPDPTFLSEGTRPPASTPRRETTYPLARSKFFRVGRVAAIAAAIVVVVGGVFVGSILRNHGEIYSPLEAVHFRAEQQSDQLANATTMSDIQTKVNLEYGYDIYPSVGQFALAGARYDTVDGVEVAHFLYRSHDRLVSVFVARDGDIKIPEELRDHPVVRNEVAFYDHNCRGCRIVYHTVGDLIVVTATKERGIDLMAFIPGRKTA